MSAGQGRMREAFVVDTNVLVTAESTADRTRPCIQQCHHRLRELRNGGCIVLDNGWEILGEYRRNLRTGRQPGLGFEFFKWLLNSQGNAELCTFVTITEHPSRGYQEFPDHDGLSDFDPADRKFVAVAARHPDNPVILQATDSKWVGWGPALRQCGIEVEFVCLTEITATYERKMARG